MYVVYRFTSLTLAFVRLTRPFANVQLLVVVRATVRQTQGAHHLSSVGEMVQHICGCERKPVVGHTASLADDGLALHADVNNFFACLPEIAGGTWLGTLGTPLALGQLMRTQPSTLRSLA